MSVFLILFIASATGIVILIGRKMLVLKNTPIKVPSDFEFVIQVPDFEQLRQAFDKKSSRISYISLVIIIRLYVLVAHFLKRKILSIFRFFRKIFKRKNKNVEQVEIENAFLKKVTIYKKRIRRIKQRIEKEEGLN